MIFKNSKHLGELLECFSGEITGYISMNMIIHSLTCSLSLSFLFFPLPLVLFLL